MMPSPKEHCVRRKTSLSNRRPMIVVTVIRSPTSPIAMKVSGKIPTYLRVQNLLFSLSSEGSIYDIE
jgi:hypothetical protein